MAGEDQIPVSSIAERREDPTKPQNSFAITSELSNGNEPAVKRLAEDALSDCIRKKATITPSDGNASADEGHGAGATDTITNLRNKNAVVPTERPRNFIHPAVVEAVLHNKSYILGSSIYESDRILSETLEAVKHADAVHDTRPCADLIGETPTKSTPGPNVSIPAFVCDDRQYEDLISVVAAKETFWDQNCDSKGASLIKLIDETFEIILTRCGPKVWQRFKEDLYVIKRFEFVFTAPPGDNQLHCAILRREQDVAAGIFRKDDRKNLVFWSTVLFLRVHPGDPSTYIFKRIGPCHSSAPQQWPDETNGLPVLKLWDIWKFKDACRIKNEGDALLGEWSSDVHESNTYLTLNLLQLMLERRVWEDREGVSKYIAFSNSARTYYWQYGERSGF
ncbi:MAG: hypothetical protein M1820_006181 [Bogoriella megaspora]|nr:MAG: hypothetical protein M1820_006181 [Bogoriella megaspora]